MRPVLFLLTILVGLAAMPSMAEDKRTVLTVTPALSALAQEIATADMTISYPGPADENAADWTPGDAELRQYQQADLILLVGAGYSPWTATAALPRARMIDTSQGFADLYIGRETDVVAHQHGPSGDANHHSEYANTFWLNPKLAQRQAREISRAFSALWPELAEEFQKNLGATIETLEALNAALTAEFTTLENVQLFASHPVYQYMDQAYGLGLHSFHWEPDQHPDSGQWKEFDAQLDPNRRTVMIWEEEPMLETLKELQNRDVSIIVVSPSFTPSFADASLREKLGFPKAVGLRQ
ncbi:zinc transport system substrate-binding protein [Shimia gijangensis]|uniref:Zinc transport system substrate-binding protein n=1 Tax=Shimia gijangensis TaxID=1470563 RepID=A0A1M6DAK3_9RHOB|nr:metal ABC transporter substrate-binding protein [Shimia gijangensis]SHI70276.1 zinc transport system substrate-binding protein [Shimia gijangensis]